MARLVSTPGGRRIEVRQRVHAPRARVWDLFRDTEAWPEWGPSVRAVESPRRYIEADTTGHVRTVGGIRLPFEVVTFGEYRWTWDVATIPATGHRVDDARQGSVAVIEIPPLVAPYVPVCRRGLRNLRRLATS